MTAWSVCRCGHLFLLHDVEDSDGTDPLCCVEGCSQIGCRTVNGPALDPGQAADRSRGDTGPSTAAVLRPRHP